MNLRIVTLFLAITKSKSITLQTKAIAADYRYGCIIGDDRRVYCCGINFWDRSIDAKGRGYGVFDANEVSKTLKEVSFGTDTGTVVTHITKTVDMSMCVLLSNFSVRCWGLNASGQLGDGTTQDSVTPTFVAFPSGYNGAKLLDGTCIIRLSDGNVLCWGAPTRFTSDGLSSVPVPISLPAGLGAKYISNYGGQVCAILTDDTLVCMGSNQYGQVGDNSIGTDRPNPVLISFGNDNIGVSMVSCSSRHTCAILNNGVLYCWGFNDYYGMIGDGTSSNRPFPVPISVGTEGEGVKSVFTSYENTCAITSNDDLYCWGANHWAQLGDGSKNNSNRPKMVVFGNGLLVKDVALGTRHMMALLNDEILNDDSLVSWGQNAYGQLSDGTLTTRSRPVPTLLPNTITSISNSSYDFSSPIELPAPFTLPSPNCTIDVTNGTSVGDVTCTFKGIISPSDAIVFMTIKADDCVSNYDATQFNSTVVKAKSPPVENATTFIAVTNVDPSSGYEGEVSFCVRTDLADSTSYETMVYRSEKIKLTFTYDGSFEVGGFSTTPFVGIGEDVTAAVKNFGVTATVCDLTGNTLSNPPALSIGTNLFVCLKTTVVGTNIPTITSFIAQKGTDTPYTIAGSSPNTVVIGLESSSVQIVTNLPARFFADATVIVLSGSVVVTQDTRRRLAGSRALAEEYESAEFEMVIEVNNDDDGSSASGRVSMMSTAIFGIVVTLFICCTFK